jgi:hypothetical protein
MATIKIVDLSPVGSEFFTDSESYLNELTNDELNMTQGGSTPLCVTVVTMVTAAVVSYQIGRYTRR